MAGSLINPGGFLGSAADPCQYFVSAAANSLTGGSPLFDPGALGKYTVVQGNPASIPYTSGLAKFGSRTYQLVKLDSGATATFGALLIWKDYSDYIVTTAGTTTQPNDVAGLLVTGSITTAGTVTSKTIDGTNGNYIYMAVDGIFPYLNDANAVVDGAQILASVTTTGTWFNGAAVGTAPTVQVNGVALSAKAALFSGITTTGNYAHGNFRVPKLVAF